MNSAESNFRAWIRKADHDLLNIENNLAAKEIPWDTVCFHAQQVVEKVLKAFLVHQGNDLLKTHDLVALLAQLCGARCHSERAGNRLSEADLLWRRGSILTTCTSLARKMAAM